MSMNINDLGKKAKGPRVLPKPGVQPARVIHVVDMGIQKREPYKGQPKDPARALWVNFELVNDKFDQDGKMVPHRISPRVMTVSNSDKSAVYKLLQSLNPDGSFNGDLSKLVNLPCMLTVVHNKVTSEAGTVTYGNVGGVMPAPEGFNVNETSTPAIAFSWDNPKASEWKELPAFIKTRITEAVNYRGSKVDKMVAELEASGSGVKEDDVPY